MPQLITFLSVITATAKQQRRAAAQYHDSRGNCATDHEIGSGIRTAVLFGARSRFVLRLAFVPGSLQICGNGAVSREATSASAPIATSAVKVFNQQLAARGAVPLRVSGYLLQFATARRTLRPIQDQTKGHPSRVPPSATERLPFQ